MTGAIEFLRKAKADCDKGNIFQKREIISEIINYLTGTEKALPEADLVSKVMAYKIKEVADAEK